MKFCSIIVGAILALNTIAYAQEYETSVEVSQSEVDAWNKFASSLLTLHRDSISKTNYRVERRSGYYGGEYAKDYRFLEESFFAKSDSRLLSRIRWHDKNKNLFQTIEVFIYDRNGLLTRDYTAAYLLRERNAPFQTLINIHKHDDKLHAYRQFDASDELLFEKCNGTLDGSKVSLLLEDYEMPDQPFDYTGEYLMCFSNLPKSAGAYLDPLVEIAQKRDEKNIDYDSLIKALTSEIAKYPRNEKLYLKRGHAYLMTHAFSKSIEDYSNVIQLNPNLDEAYYGRGLAYGRDQQFKRSIDDLSEYIRRDPDSSRGYTKRGVRYIWMGKLDLAKQDLLKAIALDHGNAEANDDLGVLYAQEQRYKEAIEHFQASIRHDPTYQKAYHNLAMAYYLTDKNESALSSVKKALALDSRNKNSTLLMSVILKRLGRIAEAEKVAKKAQLLDEGNWSELMTPMQ